MDAYTSGPWQVSTDSRGLFLTITNHQSVPIADRICDTANAALIAAAPDLLAALREWTYKDNVGLPYEERLRLTLAAIAKATGEQS